jgi:hypothetical protein
VIVGVSADRTGGPYVERAAILPLAVEQLTNHVPRPLGAPSGSFRPLGIGLLDGDAVVSSWLIENQSCVLVHDEVGWVVTSPLWTDGRVYRLFDGTGLATGLATENIVVDLTDAHIPLEPGTRYTLALDGSTLTLTDDSPSS